MGTGAYNREFSDISRAGQTRTYGLGPLDLHHPAQELVQVLNQYNRKLEDPLSMRITP